MKYLPGNVYIVCAKKLKSIGIFKIKIQIVKVISVLVMATDFFRNKFHIVCFTYAATKVMSTEARWENTCNLKSFAIA